MGRFGQKTGSDHTHDPETRRRQSDPEIESLIKTEAAADVEQRDVTEDEILARCFYPLINEERKFFKKALRNGPVTSMWCMYLDMPFRSPKVGRCSTQTRLKNVMTNLRVSNATASSTGNPHRCLNSWQKKV